LTCCILYHTLRGTPLSYKEGLARVKASKKDQLARIGVWEVDLDGSLLRSYIVLAFVLIALGVGGFSWKVGAIIFILVLVITFSLCILSDMVKIVYQELKIGYMNPYRVIRDIFPIT
jgi:hypothetical protein